MPHSPHRAASTARQGGFTLIEVLVAIVVLSFGLLGMVGLQAASLQANRDARLQSSATVLARELAEMMRGNKNQAMLATANPYLGQFTSPLAPETPSYCMKVGSSCSTPADVATAQLTEWLARVDAELPGAQVTVCNDGTPFKASDHLPQWTCTNVATDPVVVKIGWTRTGTKTGEKALDRATRPSVVLSVTAGSDQ